MRLTSLINGFAFLSPGDEARTQLDQVLSTDLAAFVDLLREHQLSGIVIDFPAAENP